MTNQHRIGIILGTRPEAIKLAPVIQIFRRSPDFELQVILTGQHREMVE
ncbi:MAG: UDP-N-acetylglucosamine 2-epimerase (non-hydrolyzing), partial [Dolichospermum sp.]